MSIRIPRKLKQTQPSPRDSGRCCRCANRHEGWPDKDDRGELCQMCWESQCSESFWKAFGKREV
jgi:hypothetical protein